MFLFVCLFISWFHDKTPLGISKVDYRRESANYPAEKKIRLLNIDFSSVRPSIIILEWANEVQFWAFVYLKRLHFYFLLVWMDKFGLLCEDADSFTREFRILHNCHEWNLLASYPYIDTKKIETIFRLETSKLYSHSLTGDMMKKRKNKPHKTYN